VVDAAVVDASVMLAVIADPGPIGDRLRHHLRGHALVAPDILVVEVASVLRRHTSAGLIDPGPASRALATLAELDLDLRSSRPLLSRIWHLRHTITAYDAAYVALAEAIDAPLVTADRRLASAARGVCAVDLVGQ
jgi:predicted nucleic acid-binding protein